MKCCCEDSSHFSSYLRTPDGNPGHDFGIEVGETHPIRAKDGVVYEVCVDCADDCHRPKQE